MRIASQMFFNSPNDKLVWDVGYQAYAHKIITGRRDRFPTLRQWQGVAPFPRVEESPHDTTNPGHGSTSISAALGYAVARDLWQLNQERINKLTRFGISNKRVADLHGEVGCKESGNAENKYSCSEDAKGRPNGGALLAASTASR